MPRRVSEDSDDEELSDDEFGRDSDGAGEEGSDEEYGVQDWAANVRDDGKGPVVSQHRRDNRGPGAPLKKPVAAGNPNDKDSKKHKKDLTKKDDEDKKDQSKDSGKNPKEPSKK